jgi:hypothetical protein
LNVLVPNAIDPDPVSLRGAQVQFEPLVNDAGQEAPHRILLPSGLAHDRFDCPSCGRCNSPSTLACLDLGSARRLDGFDFVTETTFVLRLVTDFAFGLRLFFGIAISFFSGTAYRAATAKSPRRPQALAGREMR